MKFTNLTIFILTLILSACQTHPASYGERSYNAPTPTRTVYSLYSNWSCVKTSYGISTPTKPYCIENWNCFESQHDFTQCKTDIEGYISAINQWKVCVQKDFISQAETLNESAAIRMNCIIGSPNCPKRWIDKPKSDFIIPYSRCSTIVRADNKEDIECKIEKPDIPFCLDGYIRDNRYISECKNEIATYQEDLKEWLKKSLTQKNDSVADEVNYTIERFNQRAETRCN